MILKKTAPLLIALFLLLCGCSQTSVSYDYWLMDTLCTATLYDNIDANTESDTEKLLQSIQSELYLKDNSQIFFSDSDELRVPISQDISDTLRICLSVSKASDGAFDLTVAPLVKLWDIQNAVAPPSEENIAAAMKLVGYKNIEITDSELILHGIGTGIDLGAVGKGYAGERAAEELKKAGYKAGLLNLGGNLTVFGENPKKEDGYFVIGIKNPEDTAEIYASVKVKNTNVVTAGAYERYFVYENKIYHHIIDPATGYPSESDVSSATVICKNGALADALATAVFVCGSEKGFDVLRGFMDEYGDIAAVVYTSDGNIKVFNITGYNLETYDFSGSVEYYE